MHLLNYLIQQIKSIDCDIKFVNNRLKFVFYLHLRHSETFRLVALVSRTEENVRKINESSVLFPNNYCENQVCLNTCLRKAGFDVNSNFAFFISNIESSLDNVLHPMLLCQTVVRTGLVGSRLWNQYLLRAQRLQQDRQTTL